MWSKTRHDEADLAEMHEAADLLFYYAGPVTLFVSYCAIVQIARGDVVSVMIGVILFAISGSGFLFVLRKSFSGLF